MALLGAGDLAAGYGISRALNAVMRQFSGLATDADDMEARTAACPSTLPCYTLSYLTVMRLFSGLATDADDMQARAAACTLHSTLPCNNLPYLTSRVTYVCM